MNYSRNINLLVLVCIVCFYGCSNSKKFKSSFPTIDAVMKDSGHMDSSLMDSARIELNNLKKNRIEFHTFSAKLKVNYADANGSQPEGNIVLRLYKDSAMWISLSGSILNLELYRILITPDSVTILNKLDKTVEYRSFRFMEDMAHIPLDFSSLQDLIVGNPIYLEDSILGFQSSAKNILIATQGSLFRNIIALSPESKLLQTSNLTENNPMKKRAINLFYGDYQKIDSNFFPTTREIIVDDENKIKIALHFKQVEFNKELSLTFNVPPNYKTK